MKCEKCGEKPATNHYKKNINGREEEAHLCAECAEALGYGNFFDLGPVQSGGMSDIIAKLISGMKTADTAAPGITACAACGYTAADINRTGKLGCPVCYSTFREPLRPLIRRIHGAASHNGGIPQSAGPDLVKKRELARLKSELARVVSTQEYEEAARIRDEIRAIEGGAGHE